LTELCCFEYNIDLIFTTWTRKIKTSSVRVQYGFDMDLYMEDWIIRLHGVQVGLLLVFFDSGNKSAATLIISELIMISSGASNGAMVSTFY
jgi:hypothetical protein